MITPELSVVIPAYNESSNLPVLVDRLLIGLEDLSCTCEIILVNDGSSDATAFVAEQLAHQHPAVRVLHFSRNFGKEAALTAGMDSAAGQGVLFMDADLQHPPELLAQMVQAWRGGAQVVNAVKRSRGHESWLYRLCSRFFNWGMSAAILADMSDASDYKLLDRCVVQALRDCPERVRFFRGLVAWVGFVQVRVDFDVADRHAGKTSWPISALVRYTLQNLLAFSSAPLYWVAFLGLAMSVLSCVLLVQTLYNHMMGLASPGFTTVISLQIILSGIILCGLGVIAVYIAMIYTEIKRRPMYVINHQPASESQRGIKVM
jgi:dolichol-phosphate mannosyltransferase